MPNKSGTTPPTEWATPADIPDGTTFTSRDDGGRWVRENGRSRYIGTLWADTDLAPHAPFIPAES